MVVVAGGKQRVTMPKATTKTRPKTPEYDSDDDYLAQPGPSQAQTQTMTQAQKSLASANPGEIDRKVNDLVQYLLIMDQKKLPVKRQDINKHVLKQHNRAFPLLIQKAQAKLRDVFGLDLVEIEGKQKSYILVSLLENSTEEPHLQWQPEDNAKMGLLMVILGLIFMNGNVLPDTLLWHTLKKLGLDIEQNDDPFRDVKRLVTQEFVRQGYLEYIRQPTSDPPSYEFKWGQRAKLETSKRNVLDFVCQIYGDVNPEQWTSQWQDIIRSEGIGNGEVNSDMIVVD